MLHPQKDDNLQGKNLSCVVRISQCNYSALLTGDIEYQAEQRLVREFGNKLNANVLIAPHHGSRTSSSAAFIDAVDAEYVIFPVGYRNRFAFLKEDIIERYHKRQIKTLNTARSGTVGVYTDKMRMNVTSYRRRQRRSG